MDSKNIIAVDLGASNLRIALITKSGEILKNSKTPTIHGSESTILKQIIDGINNLLKKEEIESASVIGISVAGPIDTNKGSVILTNLNNKNILITEPLQSKFKKKVVLMNDANAAVLAEKYFGAGKNFDNLVYVTISTGIGGGAIIDGELLLGATGSAVEIGHFYIDECYNLKCSCGGANHWEAYCSGKNIQNFFRVWAKKNNYPSEKDYSDVFKIFSEAENGDKLALQFMKEYGKVNAKGILNIIAAYNPSLIILGGGIPINHQDAILSNIKIGIENHNDFFMLPEIKITELGDENCLLGIAAATIHNKQTCL